MNEIIILADFSQGLKGLPLFFSKLGRYHHIHGDKLIAAAPLSEAHDSFVAQPEYGSALSAFRYLDFFFAFKSRNGNFRTQDGLNDADRDLAIDVISLSLEERVFFHVNNNVKVSGRTVMEPGFAFALDAQACAIIHAGRNSDFQHFFFADAPFSLAGFTWLVDDPPASIALTAGSADREESLLIAHLAGSMAGRAGDRILAFGSSAPIASSAGILSGDFNFGFEAESRLREGYFQIVAKVGAPFRASPAASAENIAESEKIPQDVPKISKGSRIESSESSLQSAMAISIVAGPFIRIAQNAIGFRRFLEFFFRAPIIRILVRVILLSHFSIGALDFLIGSILRNAQHFIVIAFVVQCTVPAIDIGLFLAYILQCGFHELIGIRLFLLHDAIGPHFHIARAVHHGGSQICGAIFKLRQQIS
jgi:hypothetical protein